MFEFITCLSVRPSVRHKSWFSKTAKRRNTNRTPRDNNGLWFHDVKDLHKISMESPQVGAPMHVGWGNLFHRSRNIPFRRLTAENLCPSVTVVRVHNCALVEVHADLSPSSITWYRPRGGDALRLGR